MTNIAIVCGSFHKEEIEKRDAVIQEYTKIVKAIEEEYAENRRVLEDRKKKEVKTYSDI